MQYMSEGITSSNEMTCDMIYGLGRLIQCQSSALPYHGGRSLVAQVVIETASFPSILLLHKKAIIKWQYEYYPTQRASNSPPLPPVSGTLPVTTLILASSVSRPVTTNTDNVEQPTLCWGSPAARSRHVMTRLRLSSGDEVCSDPDPGWMGGLG